MTEAEKILDDIEAASRAEVKKRMVRDAGLVALKRQAEWHDIPSPTINQILDRISQVSLYPADDAQTQAMKELVLLSLTFRRDVILLRQELSCAGVWNKLKRWLGW